ncbi:conserved hypothetical protein [Helicobacter canadensis MIT 98-5491]|uniref:TIGR02757 family protein n=1 Tax=Helicobacter canadensis MIT 98-5491 TaxID=537970 RepID=C5ZZ13_9HELI|nr:conserved hypothetical protein [Helicobacter canadensis MIT 98-5491]
MYHLLEEQYEAFNHYHSITTDLPDPLGVARQFMSDKVALFCALFAYGNARAIVRFLESCNLYFLDQASYKSHHNLHLNEIPYCTNKPYRFQNQDEIQDFFESLLMSGDLYEIFYRAYKKDSLLKGIEALQNYLYSNLKKTTKSLEFLIGKSQSNSPLKRWNMFLRWMVRKDCVDLGLWEGIKRSDLILPLDTHTFRVSQRLGILKRKSYDLKAALEVSEFLKKLDLNDPIKYDFALYRIGQLGLI